MEFSPNILKGDQPVNPRQENDFYPTPPEAVEALWLRERRWWNYWALGKKVPIWEPACGDGAICEVLAELDYPFIATDLIDRGYPHGVGGVDFLKTAYSESDIIITNPPFNLAADFIRHGWGVLGVSYMALLLKSTYWHAHSRYALFDMYRPTAVYPLTWRLDFMDQGNPTMECAWFVWDRVRPNEYPVYRPLLKPNVGQPSFFDAMEEA